MVIVMHRDSYVGPHAHVGKGETLLVLEGEAVATIFTNDGEMIDAIPLGAPESGKTFFYRMPGRVFHGLWIATEWLVYVETTVGPFRRDATIFPSWGPDPEGPSAITQARKDQLKRSEQLWRHN